MTNNIDPFQDIRPYNDEEVRPVIDALLNNKELLDVLGRFKYPRLKSLLGPILNPPIQWVLRREFKHVTDVSSWQKIISKYMGKMLKRTVSKLTYSGLEYLKPDTGYLFISNHRDITMDPALVSYGLDQYGLETARVAIGDNLLQKPYVSDIMRLNKSFVVKRSASGVREKMKAYMELSSYIDHSVHTGHNIWIAQREGRAKDGVDTTDVAVMKMLYMSKKKSGQSYADYINSLHIVPVSIAYEFDPCDKAKACELAALETSGEYVKAKFEDMNSIVKGIVGHKGKVHVAFGEPLEGQFDTPEDIAFAIDSSIAKNYQLQTTNVAAHAIRQGQPHEEADALQQRFAELTSKQQEHALAMYVNPVLRQQQFKAVVVD
ncbi:MAG: 1-acyl-sn-glycerol-3-phosphate acyltransferase [Oceanospirillaceae bacterium]|nr:1-acyl-sn-glycerol-3-phosphate acyltransferase [Oceanospirillaceae bacterium]